MQRDPADERDELGFRLEWPADALVEPYEREEREESEPAEDGGSSDFAPPADRGDAPPPPPAAPPRQVSAPASLLDAIALSDDVAGLAAVAARVDALSSATVTFRNAMADQVSESAHRVAQSISEQTAELEHALRGQGRAIDALGGDVGALTTRLHDVVASVEALGQVVEDFRSEVGAALEAIAEEVRTLRRRTPVRPRSAREEGEDAGPTGAAVLRAEGRTTAARRRPRQG